MDGTNREVANHPEEKLMIRVPFEVSKYDMIRVPVI